MSRKQFSLRVNVLALLLLGMLGLAVLKTARLQVAEHQHLRQLAREQYLREVKLPAQRGHLHDRNGKALAISVDVPSIYANPQMITDPRAAARALAKALGAPLDTVYQRLAADRYFVWLDRQVTPEVAERVRALGIPGVSITKESKRFYPNRELASHVLGFCGVDGRGLEGIERELEERLAGEPEVVVAVRDARGHKVLEGVGDVDQRGRGADVYLTLDANLQHSAEVAIERGARSHKAKSVMAVVLDVRTAEILAMAVEPKFNPNDAGAAEAASRRNRVVTDVYEPASVLKPLVIASALDIGAVAADEIIYCENGNYEVGGHTIRDGHKLGWTGLEGVIEKSSNIGAAKVGQAMGKERLHAALRRLHFGERTGVPFPGESAGMLRDPSSWSSVATATISFGHGVAVTALQLAAAYRALAAGGMYRSPTLIRSVRDAKGASTWAPAVREERVFSAKVAAKVVRMLEAAAGPNGTGYLAQVPGYRVAGKTGTARKIDPVTGSYSSDRHVVGFAGFLPAGDPKVVIVVSVDEPKGGSASGGSVAAPIFAEIGAAAMQHLGVTPDSTIRVAKATEPEVTAETGAAVEVPSAPAPKVQQGGVPSFVGLTARAAVAELAKFGPRTDLRLSGTGRVARQNPRAGSDVSDVTAIELWLVE